MTRCGAYHVKHRRRSLVCRCFDYLYVCINKAGRHVGYSPETKTTAYYSLWPESELKMKDLETEAR